MEAFTVPSFATTSVKLEPDVKERLQRLAEARQRKPHWLMREAISQYLEREEKRQALYDDASKAWEEYQANGLHVTLAEADAWLAELEAGNDVEPPKCHP
jgi:predicted transcriptional regulator